jgi:prepilin-type N-terminal cleavage/methylation domain-containing protein
LNTQKGMTMVELIVATAITGVIVVFLGTAIYQILSVTGYGNDRLSAAHDLENTAYWFNLDGQRAVAASGGSGLALTLSDNSTVTYTLTGIELRRNAGGAYMVLARNVASINFSISNRVITMSLTSSPTGRYGVSENGTYQVLLRPAVAGL